MLSRCESRAKTRERVLKKVWGILRMAMDTDQKYMKQALTQAKRAAAIGEVPIGCVIVYEGRVIARGYNRRTTHHSALAHAEILAIKKACRMLGDWRLEGCTMYVTLEPCPMCAGAIVQARMDRVVMGTKNPKAGCAGSVLNLLQTEGLNHRVEITEGVLEESCRDILQTFFRELRERLRAEKQAHPPVAVSDGAMSAVDGAKDGKPVES